MRCRRGTEWNASVLEDKESRMHEDWSGTCDKLKSMLVKMGPGPKMSNTEAGCY